MQRTIPKNPKTSVEASDWSWRSTRLPIAGLLLSGVVLALASLLDQGSAGQRDLALIVGTIALYGLLPLMAIWLAVVVAMRMRRPGS